MIIKSLENKKIKELIKLQQKKYRDLTGTYIVEGKHSVLESYKASIVLEVVAIIGNEFKEFECDTFVTPEIMKKISSLNTSPSVIAVCRKKESKLTGNKLLLLDEIQDPGNLGTIIRSAAAFNIDTLVLGEGTVDLYNPKVLRATQGIHLKINIVRMNLPEALKIVKANGIKIYGTDVTSGTDVKTLKELNKKEYCLIMGNEGNGLQKNIQDMCDSNLYIKMNNQVESLNVAVACSILLYELEN